MHATGASAQLERASVHALCHLSEMRCQSILRDRYDVTMDVFEQASELKKNILQDDVNCVEAAFCPLELDAIVGGEMVCSDGFSTDIEYPCRDIDLMSFVPLSELGSVRASLSPFIFLPSLSLFSTSTPRATTSGDGRRTTTTAGPRPITR